MLMGSLFKVTLYIARRAKVLFRYGGKEKTSRRQADAGIYYLAGTTIPSNR